MQATEWGPGAWKFLHAITFAQNRHISPEQKQRLKQFFELIGYMLPCGVCQKHYRDYVRDHPVPVDDREQLSRWLVDLHNHVNVITENSFIQNMEYADVRDVYAYDYEPIGPHDAPNKVSEKKTATSVVAATVFSLLALVAGVVFFLMYTSCRQGRCPMV